MRKKAPTQDFEMTLGEFAIVMKAKITFMKRDAAELAKQGLTAENITQLETDIDDFNSIATDDELVGLQVLATAAKDKSAQVLKDDILEVTGRVASKYGTNSGYYRQLGNVALSELDGGDLSTSARRVHRVGTRMAADLADEGLTPAMLTKLKADTQTYDVDLAAQEDAIADRDISTQLRIEKANAIYAVALKYCEKGKRVWQSVNEAKYNDYLFYTGTPPKPPQPGANSGTK